MTKRNRDYSVKKIKNTFSVIHALRDSESSRGVSDLGRQLKLHKNLVFRALYNLKELGYVVQNEDETYELGPMFLLDAERYKEKTSTREVITSSLKNLVSEVKETCSFAYLVERELMYEISISSPLPISAKNKECHYIPAINTPTGRLLLAHSNHTLNEDTVEDLNLNSLKRSSMILDRGLSSADCVTLSHLVKGATGSIVGAVEITSPLFRFKHEVYRSALVKTAVLLEKQLRLLGVQNRAVKVA